MDPLESLLTSQSTMPELLEHGFDGDISSAPLPDFVEGDGWVDQSDDATDRAIFGSMVTGAG